MNHWVMTFQEMPEDNGRYDVIAAAPSKDEKAIYVVIAFSEENKQHPYVCWFYNPSTKGFGGGIYCKNYHEAMKTFARRTIEPFVDVVAEFETSKPKNHLNDEPSSN